jgi:hypothetical protein
MYRHSSPPNVGETLLHSPQLNFSMTRGQYTEQPSPKYHLTIISTSFRSPDYHFAK